MLGAKFGELGAHFPAQPPSHILTLVTDVPTLIFISDDTLFSSCPIQVHLGLLAEGLPDVLRRSLEADLSPLSNPYTHTFLFSVDD